MSLVNTKRATYGVFIIESLRSDDDFDGDILHQILEMSGINARYREADTVEDFQRLIEEFKSSAFRYLHLSCHADRTGLEIGGEEVTNERLAELLTGGFDKKRLFMSACQGANRDLAKRVITESGAMSLIGTPVDLYFNKSVLFWPSFYHIINELDTGKMTRKMLIATLQKCTDLFGVPINYYSKIRQVPRAMRRLKIRKGKPAADDRLNFK
jgi:hypothetical protein